VTFSIHSEVHSEICPMAPLWEQLVGLLAQVGSLSKVPDRL
jgi:hypothetical protein